MQSEQWLALFRLQSPRALGAPRHCATRARSPATGKLRALQSPLKRTASASNYSAHRPAGQNVPPMPECPPGVRVEEVAPEERRTRDEKGLGESCPHAPESPSFDGSRPERARPRE